MLAYWFLELTEYGWFRRLVWKPIYNHLAKKFPVRDWVFMNYGFDPPAVQDRPALNPEDEPDRFPLQLYHFLATEVQIKDCQVLEVGSGRGGGASYIARYLHPAAYTGMDIAENAVSFSRERHSYGNLQFVAGNAEKMPFEAASFEVVLNVESSHAYGSVELFFAEVLRVLKPGGYFLITDMRDKKNMGDFEKKLLSAGMDLVSSKIISPQVVRAIEEEDEAKRARIRRQVPARYVPFFEEFGGVKGSQIEKSLNNGNLVYFMYVLRKPAN